VHGELEGILEWGCFCYFGDEGEEEEEGGDGFTALRRGFVRRRRGGRWVEWMVDEDDSLDTNALWQAEDRDTVQGQK
jgi:hypothetical protein